jgi:hypothetical protein
MDLLLIIPEKIHIVFINLFTKYTEVFAINKTNAEIIAEYCLKNHI